jgi:hypothetical protein
MDKICEHAIGSTAILTYQQGDSDDEPECLPELVLLRCSMFY